MTIIEALKLYRSVETERLVLRRINEKDVNDIFEFASDPEVTQDLSWGPHKNLMQTQQLIQKFINSYNQDKVRDWGVVLKENNKLIGFAGFLPDPKELNSPEIGYVFNRQYWYKKFATEVVNNIVEFGFRIADLREITAECAEQNIASQKVLEKNHFVFLKNNCTRTEKGTIVRTKLYYLGAEDFFKLH